MTAPPHLDAGRIYRLAPFEEVVTELRKAFADGPGADGDGRPNAFEQAVVPTQDAADPAIQPLAAGQESSVLLGTGQSSMAGQGPYVLLGSGQSLATGQGSYALLDNDGAAVATLDGAALAARRTPAVSALATDALARDDVRRLAVFGTDVQAREHVRAMRWIRPSLEQIEIVGHEPVPTERFVAMLRGEGHPAVVATAADASHAHLICMCTSSPEPAWSHPRRPHPHGRPSPGVPAGTHVNAVGCGELPMGRVIDDLAALARGQIRRETADEITIFVPTGLALEDLVVATLAARNAGLID